MSTAIMSINAKLNGIEITFTGKPSAAVRDTLKGSGFRWHKAKKIWYAKDTEARRKIAETIASGAEAPAETLPDTSDWTGETLPGYMGGTAWRGSKSDRYLYGANLSKAIRDDLKAHGIKGVSIRVETFAGGQHITATIKATEADFIPLETWAAGKTIIDFLEYGYVVLRDWSRIDIEDFESMAPDKQREIFNLNARRAYENQVSGSYDINHYHLDKYDTFTAGFSAKVNAVHECIKSWNYDESNGMVDYFNTNFYYTLKIKRADR